MKKKLISIALVSTLLIGCGSSKASANTTTQTEVVNVENDPVMKLLISGLVIYTVQLLFAR